MDFEVIDDVVMEDAECPTADGVIDHEKENGGIVTSSLDAEKHKETAKAKEIQMHFQNFLLMALPVALTNRAPP